MKIEKKPSRKSTKKPEDRGRCFKIWRALYKFFHNTKECELQKKPRRTALVIVKESSDENATVTKDSGSSQEPLIEQISNSSVSNKTSSDVKMEEISTIKFTF